MFSFPVVFVDLETTGGSARSSRVLEVAAIRYENGEVTDEFSSLINPNTYIPAGITKLTGIREADIIDAPTFDEIADRLSEVLTGAVFVAHNVRFDYSFLKAEFAGVGMTFMPKLLCTVRLSRFLYKGVKGHSLAALIERHHIPFINRHRALDDARAIQYFSQLAYDEHGAEAFDVAVNHQLKSQLLPPNLDQHELDVIENVPGVYIFEDEEHQPLYVGKSITLKKRVLSHFGDTDGREVKISAQVHHIRTIPTGSELAALILESKLVKQLQPVFNRQLRRMTKYAMLVRTPSSEYAALAVVSGTLTPESDFDSIYGLYATRTKAKHRLDEITRTFDLCPKLMGIEKGKGACFSYSLGKCKGACIGKESIESYNRRFETALERTRLETWPYDSAIAIPMDEGESGVVIDKWMVRGFYNSESGYELEPIESTFDVDEYKIIRRFMRENEARIIPATSLMLSI